MKVCAVIVTYGDRFKYLEQVIDSCIRAGINKIIIVDNASSKNSRKQLKEYEARNKDKLKVIYLNENIGSAGGYKIGLQEAYKDNECEYILTLDDDNVIPEYTLEKVNCILRYLSRYRKDEIMLGFYRPIWEWDRRAINEGWVKGYKMNNFIGFNFWEAVLRKLKKIFGKKNESLIHPLQPAQVTSMGGLFFHKGVIEKIGYPREEFFVYADDHEYTYRFTKKGGKIFLCGEIVIKDLDNTYFSADKGEKLHFFCEDFPEIKFYYAVRNYTYLSKQFITNRVFFYGNLIVLSLWQLKHFFNTYPRLFFRRYKLFLRAVKDGLNEKLGKTFEEN